LIALVSQYSFAQPKPSVINENHRSVSSNFDWINSKWTGSYEQKVLANLTLKGVESGYSPGNIEISEIKNFQLTIISMYQEIL